ncbi:hypothetical protein KI387_024558, partial [Taxus chinensis]
FMLGLDDNKHVRDDSHTSRDDTLTASHTSSISENSSHNASHTSSPTPFYVDDTLNDILFSDSLFDLVETLDSHDSISLHTVECESHAPLSSSSEI